MVDKTNDKNYIDLLGELNDYICESEEKRFSELVFDYIENQNIKNSQFYNECLIDRRTFAKFSKKRYQPSKNTAICICLGLKLDLKQTERLLNITGYSLSPSIPFDRAIIYFIKNKIYDINLINKCLSELSLELLGYMKKIRV